MRRATTLRLVAAAALAALGMAALPSLAGAVLSGTNGRIVFVSGRGQATADEAKLRFWRIPPSALVPAVSDPLSGAAGQHRHPSWSPDRTKIAYARGNPATSDFDIFILDLTAPPGTQPANITNSAGVTDDRPAWSPDGTRIAWQSAGDILVRAVAGGPVTNLTGASATFEDKPAWTPDSQTIFYASGDPNGMAGADILREPADNSNAPIVNVTSSNGISEHQPSVSPDGTRLCFTRGPFNGTADVVVSLLNGGGQRVLSDDNPGSAAANGDYNCTWSPDGTEIAYVRGTFTSGDLVVKDADAPPLTGPVPLVETADLFDGNPDWAPDGRPACQPRSVTTPRNTAVAIVLSCPDTGPAYEQSPVRVNVADEPANGTIPSDAGPAGAGTETRIYTPRAGFIGTDTFTYNAFDDAGFAPRVTVTVNVTVPGAGGGPGGLGVPGSARCDGKRATIVGTARGETIRGTGKRDIIAALGGNDTVRGLGGADLICLGAGADKGFGGAGPDKILGQGGPDRALGGAGADLLLGGAGRDVLLGGTGRDRALGGAGRDACSARLTRSC